jgi:hypothetical protein
VFIENTLFSLSYGLTGARRTGVGVVGTGVGCGRSSAICGDAGQALLGGGDATAPGQESVVDEVLPLDGSKLLRTVRHAEHRRIGAVPIAQRGAVHGVSAIGRALDVAEVREIHLIVRQQAGGDQLIGGPPSHTPSICRVQLSW